MTETVSTERAWCECYKRNAIADECDNCDGQFSASRTHEPADMAGGELTFTEAGEHGNCVISPEGSSEAYFTLIGGGDDQAQNALAAQICRAVNSITPPAPERKEDAMAASLMRITAIVEGLYGFLDLGPNSPEELKENWTAWCDEKAKAWEAANSALEPASLHKGEHSAVTKAREIGESLSRSLRSTPPAPERKEVGVDDLPHAAQFLIERLEDFKNGSLGDDIEDACRDFDGHVSPAIERLRSALTPSPIHKGEVIETRNEEAGFVEFLNYDAPTIVRDIPGPCAILLDLNTRQTIGYRVYDPASPVPLPVTDAAKALLDHWDERDGPERRGEYEGVEYWSPAGRMVDTQFIADLRAALSKTGEQG